MRLAEAGIGLLLDFVPNHTSSEHPWVRRHPDWYVHADGPQRAADADDAFFEVRSDGRHRIAHGRDPNFAPWADTAQLDYRHPEVAAGDDPDAARGRDPLRRRRLLDGDARPRRRLPVDLGRPVGGAGDGRGGDRVRRVLVARRERRPRRLPAVPARRRGVLGPRMAAPAARLRLHLGPRAARTVPRARSGVGRRAPARRRHVSSAGRSGCSRRATGRGSRAG